MERNAYTDEIARQMFVVTADNNYILARLAHVHQLNNDFWWLTLHAVEKYLKAILLLNGKSANKVSHDVVRLHADVMRIDPRIAIAPLRNPGIPGLHWRGSSIPEFLVRLNDYGNAANRYQTYGYTVSIDDLLKADQLVWSIRRLCRPFIVELGDEAAPMRIDALERLAARPGEWRLNGLLPLERVIDRPIGDPLRTALLQLNTPFDPNGPHTANGWSASASNPPLAAWFDRLRSPNASQNTRDTAAEVFEWVLENVYLGAADRKQVLRELDAAGYPQAVPNPAARPPAERSGLRGMLARIVAALRPRSR